jgi:tetratricopeptide (TPR) repeat protein
LLAVLSCTFLGPVRRVRPHLGYSTLNPGFECNRLLTGIIFAASNTVYNFPAFSEGKGLPMRVVRTSSAGLIVFCFFSLVGALRGQDADWNRSIDAGDAAMAKQHYTEAESAYRHALAFAEKRWKKDARISASLFKVAESCNAQGRHEEAETLAKSSAASMDESLKAHKPRNSTEEYQEIIVSTTLFEKLGDLLASNQQYPDAETMYKHSLSRWQEYVSRPDSPKPNNEDLFRFWIKEQQNASEKFIGSGLKLAGLYEKEGNPQEGKALYHKLAKTAEKMYEPNDPRIVPSLTAIASSEFRLGDYAGAEPLFRLVIDVLGSSKYKDSSDMASALENYAVILKKMGHEDAAKSFLDKAALIRAKSVAVPH